MSQATEGTADLASLVALAASGSVQAYALVYDATASQVLDAIRARHGDASAEDLLEQAYVMAWSTVADGKGVTDFMARILALCCVLDGGAATAASEST